MLCSYHDSFVLGDTHVLQGGLEKRRIRLPYDGGLPVDGKLEGGREGPDVEGEFPVLAVKLALAEAEQLAVSLHQDPERLEQF